MNVEFFVDAVAKAEAGHVFISEKLHVYPTLDTTMRVVDELIAAGHKQDTMVIALEQTAGRGGTDPQTGKPRSWWSGKGNLMFSRITAVPANACSLETEFVAAYAVATLISYLVHRGVVEAKFPNDILIDGAKISGFLVPATYGWLPANTERLVNLGVGINLATTPPADILRAAGINKATCLKDHGVNMIGVGEIAALFERCFAAARQENNAHGFIHILKKIGFADAVTEEITISPNLAGPPVRGRYLGFVTEKNEAGTPIEYMRLKMMNGREARVETKSYSTRGIIKRPAQGEAQAAFHATHG